MPPPDVLDDALAPALAVERIRAMEIRGAAQIGRTAAAALGRVARDEPGRDLSERLRALGAGLIAARPTAVTMRNAVNRVLDGLREDDPDALARAVSARARTYVEASRAAVGRIAARAVHHIPAGATVLTHCHSSLAVACLVAAHREHGTLRVFADETRPWWQGHITSRLLAEAGVPVTLIVDSAAQHVMRERGVDVVFTGADAVTADGALYNKVGTSQVALAARELAVPFFTAAETDKFHPYSLDGEGVPVEVRDTGEVLADAIPGVEVLNPVFDRTPPEWVTRYITEEGDMEPSQVRQAMLRLYGDREGWL